MLMRWWYLSRLALERRLDPRLHESLGVLDRRTSTTMFVARIVSAAVAFAVFLVSLATVSNRHPYQPATPQTSSSSNVSSPFGKYSTQRQVLNGIHFVTQDGTELVYQRDSSKPMRGTVLLLHGCSHSATDFFPRGPFCSTCLGLPQETKMTSISLSKGYSVVAVSSTNRQSKCWKTHPRAKNSPDYQRIERALNYSAAVGAYNSTMPLFVVGVSSGGMFATSLPLRFPVAGVNSIVSSATCVFWGKSKADVPVSYPPHVFTHMHVRDKGTATRVRDAIRILTYLSVSVKEFRISPLPVTEKYLIDAVPQWGLNLTREVVKALKRGGFINENHELQSDPRHSYWRAYVKHLQNRLGDSLVADQSPLSEELNRAWGTHEITAEKFEQTLNFLERMSKA